MNPKATFFQSPFVAQMLGPLFLIPVLMLAGKYSPVINYDLLLIAGFGLLLCATHQTRGCAYALALLALSACVKHLWIDSHHLFQICLESSIAFSLIITSLVFTEAAGSSITLQMQMDKKEETIQFLEEDLTRQREKTVEEANLANQRLTETQQLVEETQSELSALQVLNEVLRKTTAKTIDHQEQAASQLICAESRAGLLLEEIDLLQRELSRLSNESSLVQQNGELFKELNAARFKATQTHLINETLARMVASQAEKNERLQEQLINTEQSETHHTEALQQERIHNQSRYEQLQEQLLQAEAHHIETLQQERIFHQSRCEQLQEQLLQAEQSEVQLRAEALQATQALEQLTHTHQQQLANNQFCNENISKRLAHSVEIEALYRQLREQFAEKDQILHDTRKQLFQTQTELERLEKQLQEQQLQHDPLPPTLRRELEAVEEEKAFYLEENHHLTELITQLMASAPEKKKSLASVV